MTLQELANVIRGAILWQDHRAAIGESVQECVQSSPVIEQQKVEGAHRRTGRLKLNQQPAKVVYHAFRLSGGPGCEQDQPRFARLLKLTNQGMRRGLLTTNRGKF